MIGFFGFNRKFLFIQQMYFILRLKPASDKYMTILRTIFRNLNNMQYEHKQADLSVFGYSAEYYMKGRMIYAKAGCQRRKPTGR